MTSHASSPDDNAKHLVLRIRILNDPNATQEYEADDDQFLRKIEVHLLNKLILQGIQGIRKVALRDIKRTFPRTRVTPRRTSGCWIRRAST